MLQNCYVIFDGGAPLHKIGALSENNLYIQSVKGILSSILFIPNDLQYFQNHTTVHFDLLQQEKAASTKHTGGAQNLLEIMAKYSTVWI